MSRAARRLAFLSEVVRVLMILPRVEAGRRTRGPKPLLQTLRPHGRRCPARPPEARERLQHAIEWVDQRVPGGANCYRRALLEIALDRAAAAECFHMGFKLRGGTEPGHAWLGDRGGRAEDYDAVVVL